MTVVRTMVKTIRLIREGIQKKSIFLGKSPKLLVDGVQES